MCVCVCVCMCVCVCVCVKVFCDLTSYDENKTKPAPTQFTDESKENSGIVDEEEGKIGELSSISAKSLMKVTYIARLARGAFCEPPENLARRSPDGPL